MKIIFSILLLFLSVNIFAQDYQILDVDVDYHTEGDIKAYVTPQNIYVVTSFGSSYDDKYSVIDRSNLTIGDDGYVKLYYDGKERIIIDGSQINQAFTEYKNSGMLKNDSRKRDHHNDNVKDVKASSFFSEKINGKTIKFTPDNLFKAFEMGCACHYYIWDETHIPWAEGKAGYGIGESITVEFHKPIEGFSLLNGYVDVNIMKLYKENSSIRTLIVKDLSNNTSQKIGIEDIVHFELITFTKPTTKIQLIIDDVYPGILYQDTCISAIVYHEHLRVLPENVEEEVKQKIAEITAKGKRINK